MNKEKTLKNIYLEKLLLKLVSLGITIYEYYEDQEENNFNITISINNKTMYMLNYLINKKEDICIEFTNDDYSILICTLIINSNKKEQLFQLLNNLLDESNEEQAIEQPKEYIYADSFNKIAKKKNCNFKYNIKPHLNISWIMYSKKGLTIRKISEDKIPRLKYCLEDIKETGIQYNLPLLCDDNSIYEFIMCMSAGIKDINLSLNKKI